MSEEEEKGRREEERMALESYEEWTQARAVIARAVCDLYPDARGPSPEAFAAAVLARLAGAPRPMLAVFAREGR